VQDPVAELLGFGGGQLAVQQQGPGPCEQVDGGQRQLQPGLVDREVAGGEAAEAGVLAAADVVLDPGVGPVAGLQVLDRPSARDGGVGEEDLVAHALVLVEQGQLGAGVGPLAADDDPGAVRVPGEVDQAGQFGDLGAGARGAVLLQGGVPDALGQGPDGCADLVGDGVSDGEAGLDPVLPQGAYVGEEGSGAACAVGADKDGGAVAVGVGDLREGVVQDGDVVGGGFAPAFPGRRMPARASPVLSRKHSSGW
jgi:hypothetical protein